MNALLATIDTLTNEVRFITRPVRDGRIWFDDAEPIELSELEKDGWADEIAVVLDGEEDGPELRAELTEILQRRFEFLRSTDVAACRVRHGLPALN